MGSPITPASAARLLLDLGPATVIVTLGDQGCVVVTRAGAVEVPAFPVTAVDSTSAGDAFMGNLAHAIAEGWELFEAVRFASAAAAWAVGINGAQPSMPTREQTTSILDTHR
jgi:ribokinase